MFTDQTFFENNTPSEIYEDYDVMYIKSHGTSKADEHYEDDGQTFNCSGDDIGESRSRFSALLKAGTPTELYNGTSLKMYFDNLNFLFLETCLSVNLAVLPLNEARVGNTQLTPCISGTTIWANTFFAVSFNNIWFNNIWNDMQNLCSKPKYGSYSSETQGSISMILGNNGVSYEYIGFELNSGKSATSAIEKVKYLVYYLFGIDTQPKSVPDSWYLARRIYNPDFDGRCKKINSSSLCEDVYEYDGGNSIAINSIGILVRYVGIDKTYEVGEVRILGDDDRFGDLSYRINEKTIEEYRQNDIDYMYNQYQSDNTKVKHYQGLYKNVDSWVRNGDEVIDDNCSKSGLFNSILYDCWTNSEDYFKEWMDNL